MPDILHRLPVRAPAPKVFDMIATPEGLAQGWALGALIDRCPHRGVALSRGRVTEKGTLECPF